ncbi:MAG: alpha/beta hydrolase [bacterium]|jgi:pimeloyl-ACP methyl ester carboxylesterase|nr:alpha/beta fold hydrolase [Betaproteobacteria bacterium]
MILLTALPVLAAVTAGIFHARTRVHRMILEGLRAPRVPHDLTHELPDQSRLARPRIVVRAPIECWLPAVDGSRLFAWHLPAPASATAPAVVLMHGWGANGAMLLPLARALQGAGWHVLLPDARCHGRSDDASFSSLPRFAEDIDAALAWLGTQPAVDRSRVVLIGHSVGAAAALLCASRRTDLSGVVSVSAFAHPAEVMRRWLAQRRIPFRPAGWYVLRHVQRVIGTSFDAIAPVNTIAGMACPVLLVHGVRDEIVPHGDAGRLAAAARPGVVEALSIDGAHDLGQALDQHLPALLRFLDRCLQQPALRAAQTGHDRSMNPDTLPIRSVAGRGNEERYSQPRIAPAPPRGATPCNP